VVTGLKASGAGLFFFLKKLNMVIFYNTHIL
jgi:hypothetical protein